MPAVQTDESTLITAFVTGDGRGPATPRDPDRPPPRGSSTSRTRPAWRRPRRRSTRSAASGCPRALHGRVRPAAGGRPHEQPRGARLQRGAVLRLEPRRSSAGSAARWPRRGYHLRPRRDARARGLQGHHLRGPAHRPHRSHHATGVLAGLLSNWYERAAAAARSGRWPRSSGHGARPPRPRARPAQRLPLRRGRRPPVRQHRRAWPPPTSWSRAPTGDARRARRAGGRRSLRRAASGTRIRSMGCARATSPVRWSPTPISSATGGIAAPLRANAIRINDNIAHVPQQRRRRDQGRPGHHRVGGRRGRVRARDRRVAASRSTRSPASWRTCTDG